MNTIKQTEGGLLLDGRPVEQVPYMMARGAILDDRATSYWLKGAICGIEARDPVDAFADVEVLLTLAKLRMEAAFRNPVYGGGAA